MITQPNPSRLFPFLGLAAALATGVLASASLADAQPTVGILHSFPGYPTDGAGPYAGLIQGPDGTLYGTTALGGSGPCFMGACGTVFQIAPDGSGYMVLHSFTGGSGGRAPWACLTQGPDGTLYGTTAGGGTSDFGTIFRMAPDGTGYMVLHSFTRSDRDGDLPSGLIQGPDGTLYGTTQYGGTNDNGTIFQLAPDGSGYMVVHSFAGADGSRPVASLIQGPDGTLYGTTYDGGTFNQGTIFQLAPDGSGFTLLHSFPGDPTDGAHPYAGLIQGADGTLYGTTSGFTTRNLGTVFQLAPDGSGYTVLHNFTGAVTDGAGPSAGLIQGPDGTLYGTTQYGGANDRGAIFQIASDGSSYTVLHNFAGGSDGRLPWAGLIQGADGTLYGTTYNGGTNNGGVVFQLTLSSSASKSGREGHQ